jgi:hypothetical protein
MKLTRTQRKLVALAPALLIIVCLLAFLHPLLLGHEQIRFRDAQQGSLPERLFMLQEFRAGRFPHWTPLEAMGLPFFAQLTPGVLHPLNAIYAVLPVRLAFAWNYILSFLLAGLGVYRVLRGRQISVAGALTGGLSYAVCGAFSSQSNLHYLVANATVPWAIAATEFLLRAPSVARAGLAAATFACILFAGEPQSFYVATLFVVADALVRPERWRALAWVGGVVVGGLLLSSVQLVPAIEAFREGGPREASMLATRWRFAPLRALELVIPNPFREGVAGGDYFDFVPGYTEYPWSGRVFVGPAVFVLAVAGIGRRRRTWALAAVAVVLFWLSLGQGFGLQELAAAAVPRWAEFRYPEKLVVYFSLALCLLSGEGLDRVRDGLSSRAVLAAASLLLILTGALWIWANVPADPKAAEFHRYAATKSFWSAGLALALIAGVVWQVRGRRTGAWPWALLALLPAVVFNWDSPRYLSSDLIFEKPWTGDYINSLEQPPYPVRVTAIVGPVVNPPRDVVPTQVGNMKTALNPGYNVSSGIASFLWYHPAVDRGWLFAYLDTERRDRFARIFGTEYLLGVGEHERPSEAWAPLKEWALTTVYRSRQSMPRAFVARSVEQVASPEEAITKLHSLRFNPQNVTTVQCDVSPEDGQVKERGTARVVSFETQQVVVDAQLTQPGYLVLNEAIAPGWTATDGDVPIPICRANGVVRGVKLAPGQHRVTFRYQPTSFYFGASISLLAFLLWSFAALWERRRRTTLPAPT